ncbi:MAG: ABC transporter permease, partial [Erysipelotrichia bacterium]|nr:ABC transporter permease [Erysipelotrichia bacterium]
QFADFIIEMNNGAITQSLMAAPKEEKQSLPIIKNKLFRKKSKIPLDFLLSHTVHKMKQKKWRTCISYAMTSLGLIGIGLAFSLSSTIGSNIKKAYQDLIDENALMVKLKDNVFSVNGQYAANFYEVGAIAEQYSLYVEDVGVTYYCNFESFFVDNNALAIVKDLSYRVLSGFSARHINEFTWLEDINTTIYPEPVDSLLDDEIILGLDIATLRDLCFELQIERTVSSLTSYLTSHELYVYFDLANEDWTYSDQQILRVMAFTLENNITLYHSNHLWNEYMFEERMRFPTSDVISQVDKSPWVMKKIYYLKTLDQRDELLNLLIENKATDEFIFEIANEEYYPWLYYQRPMSERNRVLVFQNTIAHIPHWHIPYFMNNDHNLSVPIKGNQGGYLIFPETLMIGFAKTIYFSKDQFLLEEIIDQQTTRDCSFIFQEQLPPSVLSGNYATSLQGGVQYRLIGQQQIYGRTPQLNSEVVVSSAFFDYLNINELPATIYIATPKNEILTEEGRLIHDFVLVPLTVTGIIRANKNFIYQYENWTTLFFQCEVGVSSFSLQTDVLAFPLKNPNKIKESLTAFQKGFPQYDAINPLLDINESVDTVCHYLSIALIIFSSISTLIAIILLTMCNYLYALEGKKEIALARCLGVNKKESRKFLFVNSLVQCFVSFVLASLELVIISAVANYEVSQTFSLGFSYVFNPFCLVPMLLLALVIAVISSGLISSRINKINPIDAMNS